MRWNGGMSVIISGDFYLQRKERGQAEKGSTDVGNSTDSGNSEQRMHREMLFF